MRFIAVDGWSLSPATRRFEIGDLAGSSSLVTTYRTLRNAVDRAGPNGAVWVFDLEPLRRVDYADFKPGTSEYKALARTTSRHRTHLERHPQLARRLDPRPTRRDELVAEYELAERQMIAWSERALALEKQLAAE